MLRLFIFFTLVFYSFVSLGRDIKYRFNVKPSHMQVSIEINGNASGSTVFVLPKIFGFTNSKSPNINIYLEKEKIKSNIYNNDNNEQINLKHKPNARIKITYNIYNLEHNHNHLFFNTSIENFIFLGNYCLMIPKIDSKELNNITFEFPNYTKAIISNANNFNIKDSIDKLGEVFFIGGKIKKEKLNYANSEIIFVGKVNKNKDELIQYINKILPIHDNFFGKIIDDDNSGNHFIFLDLGKDGIQGQKIGNFQLISTGYDSKFDYDLKKIISHENLHKWFNNKKFGQTYNIQGNNAWFIEGFNDYYTDYLNYKNKLLSLKEYISSYNFCLENYYSSELKFATNDEIGQNSFNKIFDLAYLRGRIFAHELNYEIQKRTKQTYDLDKYIKYLFNAAEKDDKFKFSMETIIETLFSLTGYDFRYFIENFLIKNNLNVNAKYILNNKNISLIKKKSIFIYHGFDYLKTNLTWKISGVKLGSKEYSSGLRNGQSVLSISESSNIDDYTIFKIDYGKVSKDIMIRPRYKKVYISQYENTKN